MPGLKNLFQRFRRKDAQAAVQDPVMDLSQLEAAPSVEQGAADAMPGAAEQAPLSSVTETPAVDQEPLHKVDTAEGQDAGESAPLATAEEPSVEAPGASVIEEPLAPAHESVDDATGPVADSEAVVAQDTDSADNAAEQEPLDEDVAQKPSLKQRMQAKVAALKARIEQVRAKSERARFVSLPIRVIIGYLPEVSERDAREYALGMAEKHFEQIGMAYYEVHEYARGYAFEVHEGGDGHGFLPDILEYFDAQGPYRVGESVKVIIRTATRLIEVQRMRDGLVAVMLPESSEEQQTDWLTARDKMTQALNRRTAFLVVGASVFVTGFVAMLLAMFVARYQPYDPPPEATVEQISAQSLPLNQWSRLEAITAPNYVRALRYRNGRWEAPEIATDTAAVPAEPAASGAASAPQ